MNTERNYPRLSALTKKTKAAHSPGPLSFFMVQSITSMSVKRTRANGAREPSAAEPSKQKVQFSNLDTTGPTPQNAFAIGPRAARNPAGRPVHTDLASNIERTRRAQSRGTLA